MIQTVEDIWKAFLAHWPQYRGSAMPESWYFCDNEQDADQCAELVRNGIKKATATSLWWFEKTGSKKPTKGDLHIVTTWKGKPVAVIRTTATDVLEFQQISAEHAELEGEGDRSLEYWRKVHWAYFSREMAAHQEKPSLDMLLLFEQFEVLFRS